MRPSWSRSMRGRATLNRPDPTRSGAGPDLPHEDVAPAAAALAPIPRGEDGAPVFREPWEAQAFAMTLTLHERGLFTWAEWADALAGEIRRAQQAGDGDDGSTYYGHWLAAIERLVAAKGVTSREALAARRDAWDRAAHATRHGDPILLENDPLHRP
jgi:nitrile hydratase accessory protein